MITIAGLTKTFVDDGRPVAVLDGVDLAIDDGEFVAIIGPSGCGKSTLLRLVGGLLDLDRGTVEVNGASPSVARREKRFGLVPQTPALLPWKTVHQNLTTLVEVNAGSGRVGADSAQVDALLERVGLAGRAKALPGTLSGGMRQRVSLARAFALQAPILLMDEPFSALDELTRSDMRYLLLELWEQARSTVVFVTHSIDEAVVLADRVVVLGGRPGRIVAEETIDLARPRRDGIEDDPRFRAHASVIRQALHEGSL